MKTASQSRPKLDVLGTAMLVGSILCWGSIPVLLRQLTDSIDAWTANGFRYPLAAVLYWPVLHHSLKSGRLTRRVAVACVIPAMLTFCGQVLWALAPYYLAASAIGFLVRLSMLWSVAFAVTFFEDERRLLRRPAFYLGLALTVVGFLTLTLAKGATDLGVTGTGVVIMFFCSLFFGLYSVSIRHFLRETPPLLAFGVVAQYVSVGTITGMLMLGSAEDVIQMSGNQWLMLIASALLGIALGHFCLYTAIRHLGAAIATGGQSVTPFVTAVLALVFLGESLSPLQWFAGVTMVLGATVLVSNQHVVASRS